MEYMTKEEKEILLKKIFDRGTIVEFLPSREVFRDKILNSKEIVRVKFGIDPTSSNIHIGRTVPLFNIRDLQDLGCEVVLIVGDFTGQIGDTSDKESERPMLSEQVVQENMESYLDQIFKILRKENTYVLKNSLWLKDMTLRQIGEISTLFSLSEFIARENIRNRLDRGKRISLRELFYPLMQGYDSFIVSADIEVGGTDQRFNMLSGREIQSNYLPNYVDMRSVDEKLKLPIRIREKGSNSQCIIMNEILLGTDGRKMSSSWGNVVNVFDEPNDMYGKIMSLKDEYIIKYFTFTTRVPLSQVDEYKKSLDEGANPRNIKMKLAYHLVSFYHNEKEAEEAQNYFINTFIKKETPQEIEEFKPTNYNLVSFLIESQLVTSKSEARRVVGQGGVKINGEVLRDLEYNLSIGDVIQKGKINFIKVI